MAAYKIGDSVEAVAGWVGTVVGIRSDANPVLYSVVDQVGDVFDLEYSEIVPPSRDYTEDQKQRYIAGGGNYCPMCGSDNIGGGRIETDSSGAWQNLTCANCGEEWQDVYKLVDIERK